MARRNRNGPKRERILDAAIVEIARRGYFQTTVSSIARQAGVADGTIYLYFGSKKEILVSIFDRAMTRFIEDGQRELARLTDPAARLRCLVQLHLDFLGQNRDLAVIFQVELRHSLHFMAEFSRSRVRDYLGVIADIVAEGQAEGVFRPGPDPLLVAKAIFGMLDEMATDWILSHRNRRLQAVADELADLVLAAVSAPS